MIVKLLYGGLSRNEQIYTVWAFIPYRMWWFKLWEHLPWYLFSSDVFESHWDSNFVSFPVVTWAQCVLVLLNRSPFPLGFHGAYHGGLHGAVSKIYTICARIFCVVPMGQAYVTYGATQGLPVLVYSETDFRLYTRIVLFATGRNGLVSVTLNIVRKMDILACSLSHIIPSIYIVNPTITKYRSFY